jgi:hypothetical protein
VRERLPGGAVGSRKHGRHVHPRRQQDGDQERPVPPKTTQCAFEFVDRSDQKKKPLVVQVAISEK